MRPTLHCMCLSSNSWKLGSNIIRFVRILVIEIFSSVLGLFGLIVGLLVSSKAPEFGKSE
jgi:hypothetical protein